MNKHIRNHQTTRALHGYHFDQMKRHASEGRAPSSPTSHTCSIPGCNRLIALHYLMCGKHWSMVSISTQRVVYATWRAYSANGRTPHDGNRYRAARAQAIAEVEQATGAQQ